MNPVGSYLWQCADNKKNILIVYLHFSNTLTLNLTVSIEIGHSRTEIDK